MKIKLVLSVATAAVVLGACGSNVTYTPEEQAEACARADAITAVEDAYHDNPASAAGSSVLERVSALDEADDLKDDYDC